MNKIITFLSLVFIFFYSADLYSQCSDAGICIIGSKHRKNEKPRSNVNFEYSLGMSGKVNEYSTDYTVHQFKFGADFALSSKVTLSAVLPVMSVVYSRPNSPTDNGLADGIVMATYTLPTGKLKNISFMGGLKLATSKIDPEKFGFFNAMGSNDLLLGVDYNYSFLNVSGGAQIPLTNYEKDGVTFKRGADVMLRAGYQRKADDLFVRFEVIGIKRLNKSSISYGSFSSEGPDTDFFQLNIMGGLIYNFSNDVSAGINLFLPMLKRDENSDGTRRTFTAAAKFNYAFDL